MEPNINTELAKELVLEARKCYQNKNAQDGLIPSLTQQDLLQTALPQLVRRVRERAYAGQDDGVRQLQAAGIAGDLAVHSQVGQRIGHAFHVAYPVVNNGCVSHYSTPLVEVTPWLSARQASLRASPRDLKRASVMWWEFPP